MKNQTKNYIDKLKGDNPQIPIVQAIIFPNGDLLKFERVSSPNEKHEHIAFLEKSTIDNYFEHHKDDDVSHCYVTTSAENNNFITYVGQGSWGGDGIIYVKKKSNSELIWFLFSDSSNPFSKVEIEDDIILAISTLGECWTIPILAPEKLKIEG